MNKSENMEFSLQPSDDIFNLERRKNEIANSNRPNWEVLRNNNNNNNNSSLSTNEVKQKHLGIYQKIGDYIEKSWENECSKPLILAVGNLKGCTMDENKEQIASCPIEKNVILCSDENDKIKDSVDIKIQQRPVSPISARKSVNNSAENLSKNYYADELIVLQNTLSDDDEAEEGEEEEVSLNSDDCVYAYRGGGEFDVSVEPALRNNNTNDDETDFLEMDFDPEIDQIGGDNEAQPISYPGSMFLPSGCNTLTNGERQLFSSPIDDMRSSLAASQSIALSKDFARVSLHLNQIKADNIAENDLVDCGDSSNSFILDNKTETMAAHSLPSFSSPLHTCAIISSDEKISKITGAKPKRILDRHCSTSSFMTTKNRLNRVHHIEINHGRSLKNNSTVPICSGGGGGGGGVNSSNSFDERNSATCSYFHEAKRVNDDTCLDCLEEEFLANTLGKEFDWTQCIRCKNNRNNIGFGHRKQLMHNSCDSNGETLQVPQQQPQQQQKHIKPSTLNFDLKNNMRKNNFLITNQLIRGGGGGEAAGGGVSSSDRSHATIMEQLRPQIETNNAEKLQKQHQRTLLSEDQLLTDNISSTFPINSVNEETIVQALDKLRISYNAELIQSHFQTSDNSERKYFKDFKKFIYFESKKNCNLPQLKRLLEMATQRTDGTIPIDVKFNPDHRTDGEMIPVYVNDILNQWIKTKNLEILKHLDKRFIESNVLGKIANIIRQSQQRSTTRRPIAEFILIPQYYPCGYVTIIKKIMN